RITNQRLLTFEVVKGGRIVETVWSMAQPNRWRDGAQNPDLFKGMMHEDAKRLAGCELEGKKDGGTFKGNNQPASCRINSPAVGTVRMDMRMELTPEVLSKAELAFGPGD